MKIVPIYKNKLISVPAEEVLPHLGDATREELAVLISVLAEPEFEPKELAEQLDMTLRMFNKSLSFWRDAGAISVTEGELKTSKRQSASQSSDKAKEVKIHTTLPHYTSDEIAAVVERTDGSTELIDSCQQILGKIFNTSETAIVIGFVDHLRLSSDYILLVCQHAADINKCSVRYIEKMILDFYDRDILEYHALEEELNRISAEKTLEAFVKKLFGVGKRALIKKEKDFIKAWSEKYAFSNELIQAAYEVTVSKTNEASMNYANAVLENWYAAGYKTLADVENGQSQKEQSKTDAENKQKSSFNTDDFFSAALKRSYET